MDEPTALRWHSLVDDDRVCHLARHSSFPRASPLHGHDFAEAFWVEAGAATYERNGDLLPLSAGDLVLVGPRDVHRFRSPSRDFTITNLAFPSLVLDELRRRYGSKTVFPWDLATDGPIRLPPSGFGRLRELAAELDFAPATRLELDRLLLDMLVAARGSTVPSALAPQWLTQALASWREDPAAMREGVGGLAALAGRSREHVSRVVRRSTSRRAIDVVNQMRIDAAAARLRMTEEPIGRIAVDVGLDSLSHFYRLFKARMGTTPGRYRLQHREFIVPRDQSPLG